MSLTELPHPPLSRPGITLPQIVTIVRPWRWLLALVAACVLAASALELAPPLIIRRIVDDNLTPRDASGLPALALLYLGATAAVAALSFVTSYLIALAAQGALHALRVRLFAHVQRLPVSYHDRTPLGETLSRCTADVETVDTLFSSGVANLVADLTRLGTVAVAMVLLSPPLALVAALVAPPLVWVTRFFQVRVRDAERANRQAVGLLNTRLQETLAGAEVIRAFHRQAFFIAAFRVALRHTLAAFNRAAVYSALYAPLMALLAAAATALLLWSGAKGIFSAWAISLGTLTAFVLLFQRFFKPITTLGDEWQTVQSAMSGLERIAAVLALSPDEAPSPDGGRQPAAGITLREVVFGYVPGRPVLHGITLDVRAGEHVALVGRTGAGKSSALHLAGGLYAPWSGSVRVAGVDPRTIAEDERRKAIGVVPQTVHLFSGSILDNLTLGDSSVAREAVEAAAVLSGADAFIRLLPQGYETLVSGSGRSAGAQLSAGQRQLLALTRALVWDPPVLLLDEATAAVDGVTDAAFRAALRAEHRSHRAVLTVAHRLVTALDSDRVVVLDAGHIVEEGPPDILARAGGRFAALLELEAAGWDWHDAPTGR